MAFAAAWPDGPTAPTGACDGSPDPQAANRMRAPTSSKITPWRGGVGVFVLPCLSLAPHAIYPPPLLDLALRRFLPRRPLARSIRLYNAQLAHEVFFASPKRCDHPHTFHVRRTE